MFKVNDNFGRLQGSYLFSEIAHRVSEYTKANPDNRLSSWHWLCDAPACARGAAGDRRGHAGNGGREDVHGLRAGAGLYQFLRAAIRENDYAARGVEIGTGEIFVSDGSKCDNGNIQELLAADCRIGVTDPVYPVYVDTNVMAGRSGEFDEGTAKFTDITYIPTTAENGFVPALPEGKVDVMYLCSPNNPTGTAMTKEELKVWVDWATNAC